MKILVTGGSGFIGSNFIKLVMSNSNAVINLDNLTYAGSGRNIEHMKIDKNKNYRFIKGDIVDKILVEKIFLEERPEIIVNFAAESHVDRSISDPSKFIRANINGTYNLLDTSKKIGLNMFIQVSTDEVYGSLGKDSKSSKETDYLCPRSPYSASKAAAEHLALSYFHTYNTPVIITRSSNNYGPYQFPEKLLPLFITNLIDNQKVPLMWSKENPGFNVRDWLHVEDNCRAISLIIQKGKIGEIYNIPGENERTNIEITNFLLNNFNYGEEMIEKRPHRKGHDFRYSISGDKLKELGFRHQHNSLEKSLKDTIGWYKNNENWWRPLKK